MDQLTNSLSTRENGIFPSQPEPNPKGPIVHGNKGKGHKHVKSIITLRTSRQIDNKVEMPKDDENSEIAKEMDVNLEKIKDEPLVEPKQKESIKKPSTIIGGPLPTDKPPKTYIPKAPYPQKLGPTKTNDQQIKCYKFSNKSKPKPHYWMRFNKSQPMLNFLRTFVSSRGLLMYPIKLSRPSKLALSFLVQTQSNIRTQDVLPFCVIWGTIILSTPYQIWALV